MIPIIMNIHPSSAGLDWANIVWYSGLGYGTITSKQVSGLTSTNLNIKVKASSVSTGIDDPTLWYQVTNTQITGNQTTAPGSPWLQININAGTTFNVNNNQWLSFVCYGPTKGSSITMEVRNASNADALIDTFTIQVLE
jgi:hypothetical protein